MPSLTTARRAAGSSLASSRTAIQSSQRSWASTVEHEPSVIESPNATMVPPADVVSTSIDLSHHIEVIVSVNPTGVSSAVRSPVPFALAYDVTNAPR